MIEEWTQKAFIESRNKTRERKAREKKEQKKNAILSALIIGFILYAFIKLMIYENHVSIERCTSMGWSEYTCIKNL